MRSIGWGLAFASLVGCAGGPASTSLGYSVSIDPGFTGEQMTAVTSGLRNWSDSIPELQLQTRIATCDAPAANQVCVEPADGRSWPNNDIIGTTIPSTMGADATVILYVERIAASGSDPATLMAQTAAHEMGHAMGLQHSRPGDLMAAEVADQAHAVTLADVEQFWAIRSQ